MSGSDKLSIVAGVILVIWITLHFYLKGVAKSINAYILLKKRKYSNVNNLYELIYCKKFQKNDKLFISKLRIELNTYIEKYKSNKSSPDNIITIIITALMTITLTSYTIASQANKELVSQIMKNLNSDFSTIFSLVIGSYGVIAIFKELASSKFEYYLMVKSTIDEVEKDKTTNNREYYTSYVKKEI